MGGELPVRRQLVFGTDRGNAAARRDDQARQEQVRMRRHVARASRHRASGARDAYCNNRRTHPTFASGRSRSRRTGDRDIVRPAKAGAFRGRQSHRGKSRSPVAWVAGLQLGNRDSEAYRQRHRKDGGESPGRSASEREVASKDRRPGGRASNILAKAAWHIANRLRRCVTPAGWLSTAW